MKMKSRVLAILLALAMVLTYMPAVAFAEGESLTDTEKNSSYGFFVWLSENAATASEKEDAAIAAQIISNTLTSANKSKVFNQGNIIGGTHNISYNDLLASLDLGGKDDATSIEKLQAAVNFISSGNSYRAKESLPALKVSSALMAMAELNADYQDINAVFDHSSAFSVLENLAYRQIGGTWKYGKVDGTLSDDPYEGWYTEEKENYVNNNGGQTGHYETLTDRQGVMLLTGFGIRDRFVTEQITASDGKKYDCLMQDRYYSQTFSSKDGMYNVGNGVTPSTYLAYIDTYKKEVINKHDHDYKVESSVDPTCTKDGSETSTCSICGDKVTKVIPATGHKWNKEYTVDTPATCKAEGSESIHCSVCNAIDETTVQTIPISDHKYGEWTVTKKATCTESGTQEKKCEYCGKTVTESIPATGHQWKSDYTTDKKATHSSTGIESIHCSVCDAIQPDSERTVPIIEHTFGEWEIVKAPTCVDDGLKKRTCKDADCGYVEEVTLPATGHKWESDYTEDKAPTCTADGSKSIHCSVCDAVKEGSAKKVRATGHNFGKWTITKKPTVDEEGSRERVCSVCGEKETESMDKLSAQAVAAAAIVEADLAAKNAESAAKEAEDLQKAADEAAKTPGDAAIAAAKKAKDAAEAYQKAAKEAKEAADRADAAVDKALEKAQNKIEIAAAEAAKERSKEIVSSADTTVKKADTAVETATVSLKDAEENKADHTGTPEIKLSATELTYKYHIQKVGKKKKKQAVAEEQKPTILTVSLNGKVISADYYDVVWSDENSKNIGKYTVTVTLKNGYKGANVATYNINPKPAKISKPAKGKKKMTVKWKKASKKDITYKALDGYEIQYSLSSDFSSADTKTATASRKAKSKAIKKLQSKQIYYVRIRTYKNAGGVKLYSDWSAVKSVKVK